MDWIGRNLYWTNDGYRKTISVARLERASQTRKTLLEGNMSHPRAIVVDPLNRSAPMKWTSCSHLELNRGAGRGAGGENAPPPASSYTQLFADYVTHSVYELHFAGTMQVMLNLKKSHHHEMKIWAKKISPPPTKTWFSFLSFSAQAEKMITRL